MSSGACRALVSVLLTLIACVVMTLPAAAASQNLREISTVTYVVDPERGTIDVDIVIKLVNERNSANPAGVWGPIVVEERAQPSLSPGYQLDDTRDLPGHWKAIYVTIPRIDAGASLPNLRVRYTLDASPDQTEARLQETPARVDAGYLFVCVPGQDTDRGNISITVGNGDQFALTQSGTVLNPTTGGLKSDTVTSPRDLFTCVEGTRADRLDEDTFPGPTDRPVVLQAWPSRAAWLAAAETTAQPTLDEIHRFLGLDIPGDSPVIIRQAPVRELGGYASAHDTPGIVQLDERGGVAAPEHELAHAWFGTDNFVELWMREGMATWTATAMEGAACPGVEANPGDLRLADWQVVRPTSDPDTIDATIAAQDAASCGIVSAMVGRMGDDHWNDVLAALLQAETKYIGTAGPSAAATTVVDYREWLDAVDERGLVPAAKARADFDGTVAGLDLDFAQDLLDSFGIPADALQMEQRSTARALYHQFLLDAAPLGAPLAVREAMDNWEFDRATDAIDKSYEVLEALRDASALLPEAGLIPVVQPLFESARNEVALDEVLTTASNLRESAAEVAPALGELQAATPEGWVLPAVISQAIVAQRFDDILDAIRPAIQVVQEVSAADAALPSVGLLEKYRARYEASITATALEELASEAAIDGREAVRAGAALDLLRVEVGDWQIPMIVSTLIDEGEFAAAAAVANDARVVVSAAQQGDLALREAELGAELGVEIRPRFEAVTTAAEMAALRAEAEVRRNDAVTVGEAMQSLATLVGEWQIPAVVTDPIAAGDFTAAAVTAAAAQAWVEKAYAADQALPQMGALERIRADFEGARSLEQLETGAELADSWSQAATSVKNAIDVSERPRDLIAELGLMGTDVSPLLDAALEAAIAGNVSEALQKSSEAVSIINSGGPSGGLRLAGIVFLAIAILGVLGLWLMLRREAGPPWARQTKPHWIESGRNKTKRPCPHPGCTLEAEHRGHHKTERPGQGPGRSSAGAS